MQDDLNQLRSLRLAYREGGDLREIIDGVMAKVNSLPSNAQGFNDALVALKVRVDHLSQGFLNGTVDRPTYTLKWDQVVRDTMKIIDELEQEMIEQIHQ